MRRLRTRLSRDRERGSIALWTVIIVPTMFLLVGLAVDFGGQIHAEQHARDVAAEAARVGGEQVAAPEAVRGEGAVAQPSQAYAAANTYLAGSGVDGTVSVTGAKVIVTTSAPYRTKFLSMIGIDTLSATGKAEARIARAVGGVEQ